MSYSSGRAHVKTKPASTSRSFTCGFQLIPQSLDIEPHEEKSVNSRLSIATKSIGPAHGWAILAYVMYMILS